MNDLILQCERDFRDDWWAIQCPTPLYPMRHFVVGQHDTPGQQWAQCTLELKNRIQNLRRGEIGRRKLMRKIARLDEIGTEAARDRADELRIELEDLEYAEGGTIREVEHLLKIKAELEAAHGGRGWTRDELDAEQPTYWIERAKRQALQDLNAHGKVMVGNQDMLRMMGRPIDPPQDHVAAVERRFLECGNVKILVAVPTLIDREKIKSEGLECLKGWTIPETIERKVYVVQGKPVADAYNDAARTALEDSADFLLCVEDDHVIPAGTFEKLWSVYQQHGPRCIVGAWYPQKREPRTGAAIVLRGGMDGRKREYLNDGGQDHILDGRNLRENELQMPVSGMQSEDRGICPKGEGDRPAVPEHRGGAVREVYAITQGFTLIPTQVFREIPQPWFFTTGCVTQDSFFSQLCREAGWKLLVDTSARIEHVCRDTGRVYE